MAADVATRVQGAELKADHLRVSYDGVLALSDVSLHVPAGRIVALVGGNGNGKSTTLRAIAGLNALDSGSVQFDGRPVHGLPAHQRVPLGLSLVPEGRRLFPKLTVKRNLELGAYTRNDADEVAASVEQMLDLFPILRERATQLAGTMSGGEQQMLAMGRALMAQPKVLLLDEPSMGLSPIMVDKIFEVVNDIHGRGTTVLLVEQNASRALQLASRGYVMDSGEVTMSGDAKALLNDPKVRAAYLGE